MFRRRARDGGSGSWCGLSVGSLWVVVGEGVVEEGVDVVELFAGGFLVDGVVEDVVDGVECGDGGHRFLRHGWVSVGMVQ